MKSLYAISTLSGTIIGVGLFALPYLTLQLGFWVILGYFVVLTFVASLVHVFFGELALRTPDFKRLPGFAKIYLGSWGQNIAYVSTALGLFGASLAYLILGGRFLAELFFPYFGGNELIYALFYFAAFAVLVLRGIKAVAKIEFWGLILFLLILFAIFSQGREFLILENLFPANLNWSAFFLPYGVILFSLWGAALIPETEEIMAGSKKLFLRIIPIAILIPALIYLFFIYLVLGISGPNTTESALDGLKIALDSRIVSLALFFGVLTTFTSIIALGLTLKKVFWYDLGFNKNLAWFITCFVPLLLYLIGVHDFIAVIFFVGAIMLAVDAILILLMYNKIRPERKFIVYPLILVFLGGIIYSIIYFS